MLEGLLGISEEPLGPILGGVEACGGPVESFAGLPLDECSFAWAASRCECGLVGVSRSPLEVTWRKSGLCSCWVAIVVGSGLLAVVVAVCVDGEMKSEWI